jgi:hypothetical protein
MTKRAVGLVLVWGLLTFGIYNLIWATRTKAELNARGANICSGWYLIVPGANFYWMWQFSAALDKYTGVNPRNRHLPALLSFILLTFAWGIAAAIFQDAINVAIRNEHEVLPAARVV